MPRPKFVPTDEQRESVKEMKAGGMTTVNIAGVIGCSDVTLEKYFRTELDQGKAEVDRKVMGALFKMAMSGECPAATFFYLKTRCGWRESDILEITGKDGGPLPKLIVEIIQSDQPDSNPEKA